MKGRPGRAPKRRLQMMPACDPWPRQFSAAARSKTVPTTFSPSPPLAEVVKLTTWNATTPTPRTQGWGCRAALTSYWWPTRRVEVSRLTVEHRDGGRDCQHCVPHPGDDMNNPRTPRSLLQPGRPDCCHECTACRLTSTTPWTAPGLTANPWLTPRFVVGCLISERRDHAHGLGRSDDPLGRRQVD